MNQLKFGRFFFILLACLTFPAASMAAENSFKAGVDYTPIQPGISAPVPEANQVSVIEFFSYACPACYHLEPVVESWAANKPKDVNFSRVPVIFRPSWANFAKAYYIAEAFDVTNKITPALFNAIHEQRLDLSSEGALAQLFSTYGVKTDEFNKAFELSPAIEGQLKKGQQLGQAYEINSVPTLVVNGKYKTDLGMVKGDRQRLIEVLNFLVQKETITIKQAS